MNDLLKTRMFSLLSESSQVTNEKMQNAYGCFMEQVRTVSQSEQDYSEAFRMLNITRVELVFIESLYRHEQEKKCPEICLSSKGFSPYQC
jgi:NH3-dependent NAD+ synthetase